MSKEITIPFLPHLKKFILIHYKLQEPIPVKMNSLLGEIAYSILISKKKVNKSNDRYGETLTMQFCDDLSNMETRINRLIKINQIYDKWFKDAMIIYVTAQDDLGIPPYQGIQKFLKKYKIKEEEYQLTTAYRAWMRYKNEEYHSLQAN